MAAEAENRGEEGEHLTNHFSLQDSKISGIPVIRAIVDGMLDIPSVSSFYRSQLKSVSNNFGSSIEQFLCPDITKVRKLINSTYLQDIIDPRTYTTGAE